MQLRKLGFDLRQQGLRGTFAFQDRTVFLCEIGSADVVDLGTNYHVGTRQFQRTQFLAHDGDALIDITQQAGGIGHAIGLAADVHRDHKIGTQLTRGIHRHRTGHAAVYIVILADTHGFKHPRDRAGGAHRLAHVATHEDRALPVFQPCCHCGEGLFELFEFPPAHLRVDVILQLLALHYTTGKQADIANRCFIQRHRFLLQRIGIHAAGIQCTDHAAGAGAGHHHRMDAVGVQHLDHADMRKPFGGAAAQG